MMGPLTVASLLSQSHRDPLDIISMQGSWSSCMTWRALHGRANGEFQRTGGRAAVAARLLVVVGAIWVCTSAAYASRSNADQSFGGGVSDVTMSEVESAQNASDAAAMQDPRLRAALSATVNTFGVMGAIILGFRIFLARRRLGTLPDEIQHISEVNGSSAVIAGQIISKEYVPAALPVQLAYLESEQTTYWVEEQGLRLSGSGTMEEVLQQQKSTKRTTASVPIMVSDGSGWAWVDPSQADVHALAVSISEPPGGSFVSGTGYTFHGLQLGSNVTVAGPCTRRDDGLLVFAREGAARVMVSHQEPAQALRRFKSQLRKRKRYLVIWFVIWTGLLLVLA